MIILVINCGSSSIKYKLFRMDSGQVLAEGLVERVGEPAGRLVHTALSQSDDVRRVEDEVVVPDHGAGLELVSKILVDSHYGVISSRAEIAAVGHRVVHGGEAFYRPTVIDGRSLAGIEAVKFLAPLHNPVNIKGIRVARDLFPDSPHVAVFDTAFHQTMPAMACRYALPESYYTRHRIRRYGFHGTSHQYVTGRAASMLGIELRKVRLISLHLGGGCSVTAVREGRSIDTSMGMTPLAGLPMGTRSGDIDPGILLHLSSGLGMASEEISDLLNKQSGLKGLCGANDMRDIHRMCREGDAGAQLAFDIFVYNIKKYIGAYSAVLGRVDALVFTAGIGENDPEIRRACCTGLDMLGIRIDDALNVLPLTGERSVHHETSRAAILVIPTDEEYEIANQTALAINPDAGADSEH